MKEGSENGASLINPLNAELNPICYLLTLLPHHFLHVSRIRVKSLTLRLLMSYIYIYDISSLRVNLMWALFFRIQIILGAESGGSQELLWKFRAPMTWHHSMGHKGPVLIPRCIGTEGAQTQLLL